MPIGERRSVREEIASAVRAALIAGEMRPGEIYSAPLLATRFGVSSTPVREAMLDLVKEGLVSVVRNKGFRVRQLSDRELDEISELRRLVEIPTVLRAVGLATDTDVLELRRLAQNIVTRANDGDLIGYVDDDSRFHLTLLGIVGNEQLVSLVSGLRARSRLFGLRQLASGGELVHSAREHVEMVDLIEAGDGPALELLVERHIDHVRGAWAGRLEAGPR